LGFGNVRLRSGGAWDGGGGLRALEIVAVDVLAKALVIGGVIGALLALVLAAAKSTKDVGS
jgi:hypothetical protein